MVDLKTRTKPFALSVIKLYSQLPKTVEAQIFGKQLLRSGTSVGAHYREAMRARSTAEFVSKIPVVRTKGSEREGGNTCWRCMSPQRLLLSAEV